MLNLLKLLIDPKQFLAAFCLFFAAGAVAAPGAEGGEAIIPGEEGDGGEGGEGAGAGEGEGGEGAGEGEEAAGAGEGDGEGEGEGAGKDTTKHPLIEGDGRTLPADLRGVVASLKATNPGAAAKIKDLYFGFANLQNQIKQNFPGGFQEAVELKDAVEDLAGPEGVTELRSEIENWRSVDNLLDAGDPAILDTIQKEFPDGFRKLLPQMVNIWADADGEAYDRHMAGIIVGTLQQNQVSGDIARAIDYLDMQGELTPALTKVKEILAATQGKIQKLAEFAQSKPKPPDKDPNAEKNQAESARIEGEKTKLFIGGVSRAVGAVTDPQMDSELKRLGAKNLTPQARNTIGEKVRSRVAAQLKAQPGFVKKYTAYIERKDHKGAVQFLTSRMEPLLKGDDKTKGAVETVYTELYGKPKLGAQVVKPKPGTAPGVKPGGEKPVQGWTKVAPEKAPAPSEIDMKASPFEMRMKKQAILKNGKKVYWGDKVPS